MKRHIIILLIFSVFAGASAQSRMPDNDTSNLHNCKHSVGLNVGWKNGIAMKFNVGNNLFVQTDIGANLHFLIPILPIPYDIGFDIKLLYEKKFPNRTNTFWFAGGSLGGGVVPHSAGKKEVSFKGTVQPLLGIEYKMDSAPLSWQFEASFGYSIIYSSKAADPANRYGFTVDENPYHFFDFALVASLHYHFGK